MCVLPSADPVSAADTPTVFESLSPFSNIGAASTAANNPVKSVSIIAKPTTANPSESITGGILHDVVKHSTSLSETAR